MTVADLPTRKPKAEPGPPKRQNRIKIMRFDEVRLSAGRRWLVRNLVPVVGLFVLWGAPKTGKSFWIFDLAMHIALGWEYRGRRVQQGAVVYCAFEGQGGLAARVEAFRQRHLAEHHDPIPFYIVPITLDLVKEHSNLITAIREHIQDETPALVVLDTLNRSLAGSESKDEDMSAYIRATGAISEVLNCCVGVVHHCGVDGTRPRGHSSLTGAADAQAVCKKDATGVITVETEWMKDGPEKEIVSSRLDVVTVGVDEDGEDISSCVIVEAEPVPLPPAGDKLTKNQITMFSLLQESGPSGLTTDEWNDRARAIGLGITRRQDLYDHRRALQARGLVFKGSNGWFAKRQG
jgi:hypothetical protein